MKKPVLPDKVPPGWATAIIQEVGQVQLGRQRAPQHHQGSHMRPYLRVANVYEARIDLSSVLEMNFTPQEFETFALHPGDVLLNEGQSLEWVGRSAIYRGELPGACFQNTLVRFRPKAILSSEWALIVFRHYVRSGAFRGIARWTTNIAHLGTSRFAELPIPVPPVGEQARITAAVDQHESDIDAGAAALQRTLAHLKRYRAAVLKAACEGRLVPTEAALAKKEKRDYEPADVLLKRILRERRVRWEADQLAKMAAKGQPPKDDKWKAKYEEPTLLGTAELPDLPEGWTWATLPRVSWDSGYGTSEKCDYDGAGPPVLRIPNIIDGGLKLEDLKYARLNDELAPLEALAPDDFLVIRTNGSRDLIGRAGLVTSTLARPSYFASYLIRFRIVSLPGLARWVATSWTAPLTRQHVMAGAATSAGQFNVSQSSLAKVVIPLPPLAEQHRIVAEVDRLLSTADETEQNVRAQLARASRLRQSVLKRAFEGKLVPQDPTDEPATVLLERIRAQKTAAAETKLSKPAARGRRT